MMRCAVAALLLVQGDAAVIRHRGTRVVKATKVECEILKMHTWLESLTIPIQRVRGDTRYKALFTRSTTKGQLIGRVEIFDEEDCPTNFDGKDNEVFELHKTLKWEPPPANIIPVYNRRECVSTEGFTVILHFTTSVGLPSCDVAYEFRRLVIKKN